MEPWLIILLISTLSIAAFLKLVLSSSTNNNLPPGPLSFPLIGNLVWLGKSISDVESLLRGTLRRTYGNVITLCIGPRPYVFIGSHSSAHRALIQNGAAFSGRPSRPIAGRYHTITSSTYGATWRLLRRNLTSEILHPSRIESYSHARAWVFQVLIDRLSHAVSASGGVEVMGHFRYAMFCLLVLMCFGDKQDEDQIRQIESVQRAMLLKFGGFNIFDIFPPWISKILFRRRLKELIQLRKNQVKTLVPIIRSRIEFVKDHCSNEAYVDTLVNLELPEEKRKLDEGDIISLCGEFLNAGTDTITTALQWIMANIVKYPEVQLKLYKEIVGVVKIKPKQDQNASALVIKEEDLAKMPYLKAVVLEGLRRHPPSSFVLPHSVMEDVELDGYVIPKDTTVNFLVAGIGWDPELWEQPMEFRPERFLSNDGTKRDGNFDIMGSKEIKMMPFGAGRRACPGANLALLHLELFVANLVWYFEWKAIDGVDLSEKMEFTNVMKNPLRVNLYPRQINSSLQIN